MEELFKASTENIKQGILEYLHQQGIEIALPFPDKCFSVTLFQRFTTEYQQSKFYKDLIVSFYTAIAVHDLFICGIGTKNHLIRNITQVSIGRFVKAVGRWTKYFSVCTTYRKPSSIFEQF